MKLRLAALALLLATAGCSSGSQDASPASTSAPNTTSPTTVASATTGLPTPSSTTSIAPTTSAAPTTTTVAPIEPQLQALLDRFDAAVAAILADPRVAADGTNPLVATYLGLFPKDSTFASGAVSFWASEGEKQRFYQAGPLGQIQRSTLHKLVSQTATEVEFTVCTRSSMLVVDASGSPIEAVGGVNGGRVVAVMVDGSWLLRDLTQTPPSDCPKPGA